MRHPHTHMSIEKPRSEGLQTTTIVKFCYIFNNYPAKSRGISPVKSKRKNEHDNNYCFIIQQIDSTSLKKNSSTFISRTDLNILPRKTDRY